MQKAIGVKLVEFKPMTEFDFRFSKGHVITAEDNRDGYLVRYEDGYESWSPKDTFDAAYLPLTGDGTQIDQGVVNQFMGKVTACRIDAKTTLATAETLTGFVCHEVSSCVDPKNFNMDTGTIICRKRIADKLWGHLGFVLQWAQNGLKGGN